jgi:hypothetical protein
MLFGERSATDLAWVAFMRDLLSANGPDVGNHGTIGHGLARVGDDPSHRAVIGKRRDPPLRQARHIPRAQRCRGWSQTQRRHRKLVHRARDDMQTRGLPFVGTRTVLRQPFSGRPRTPVPTRNASPLSRRNRPRLASTPFDACSSSSTEVDPIVRTRSGAA